MFILSYMPNHFLHRLLRLPYRLNVPINVRKSGKPTIVLLHGIGASAGAWEHLVPLVDNSAHLMAVDLLGFGGSPKPSWPEYSLDDHARSLHKTLRRYYWRKPVVIVGHSLGCLVAIEFARRWPNMVDRLVLCSPPFYTPSPKPLRRLPRRDDMYVQAYAIARNYRIGALAIQYLGRETAGTGFMVDETTLPAFMKTLQSSIEEQQSYLHVKDIKKPIDIIYGRFDTFLIEKRIQAVATTNTRIRLHKINAPHTITKKYAKEIAKVLSKEPRSLF